MLLMRISKINGKIFGSLFLLEANVTIISGHAKPLWRKQDYLTY